MHFELKRIQTDEGMLKVSLSIMTCLLLITLPFTPLKMEFLHLFQNAPLNYNEQDKILTMLRLAPAISAFLCGLAADTFYLSIVAALSVVGVPAIIFTGVMVLSAHGKGLTWAIFFLMVGAFTVFLSAAACSTFGYVIGRAALPKSQTVSHIMKPLPLTRAVIIIVCAFSFMIWALLNIRHV